MLCQSKLSNLNEWKKFSQHVIKSFEYDNAIGHIANLENLPHILDVDRIAEMRESLGAEVLMDLLERFLKESDSLLEHLANPEIRQEPLPDVIEIVHKVAGSAAVLGAIEMHTQLRLIEIESKSVHGESLWRAVDELGPVWLRTKLNLNKSGYVIS
jgi:hypothetical protein